MPKLSVVMPVYNAQQYLAEAVESILNQTFTDFEFIIIDDCSTDNSATIINSYGDARIRFYKNETNLGISKTLNRGIELSNAEWIARMDADDISYPARFQRQYNFILANPDGALFSCLVRVIDQQGSIVRQDVFRSEYYYYNLTFICWIYHPTVVYKKSAVQEVGMYTVPYAEDFELFWQLSRKYKMYNLSEVLLDYRVTAQSLHQVLKKDEYKQAEREQLLRNFRYFAGSDYFVPQAYIDCFQHNFQPLMEAGNLDEIVSCLRQLDFLSDCILKKENVNRNIEAIQAAAFYKKKFIISYFLENLPRYKALILFIRLNNLEGLINKLQSYFKRKLSFGARSSKIYKA